MGSFKYEEHPHVSKRGAEKAGLLTLNSRIGLFITKRVGTMWAAYLFFLLTLVSLPAVIASGSLVLIVGWVAQTFLQLVLLPIIIVGQNIQAQAAEERAKATFDDATAILHEVRQIQKHLVELEKKVK